MLELWGMQSTPSFIAIAQSPLWPGVVAPDWVLSIGLTFKLCDKKIAFT